MLSTGKYRKINFILFGFLLAVILLMSSGANAATTFYITSAAPAEFIGAGIDQTIPGTTADVNAIILDNNSIEISGINAPVTLYPSWTVEFLGNNNQLVTPGFYQQASITQGNPSNIFRSPVRPNLNVTINGRRCDFLTGQFIVHEIKVNTVASRRLLSSFAADFVQYCNGTDLKLSGAIRFNSTLAYPVNNPIAVAGNDRQVIEANQVNLNSYRTLPIEQSYTNTIYLNGSNSIAGSNFTLAYEWTQVSGPAITFTDTGNAITTLSNPSFNIPAVKLGGEKIVLQLKVTNSNTPQQSDTDQIEIQVISKSDPQTSFTYKSETLDSIALGNIKSITPNDALFKLSSRSNNHAYINVNNGELWNLEFSDNRDFTALLTDGTYTNATLYIGNSNLNTASPGIKVRGFLKGCNFVNGEFTISQLKRDADSSALTALKVDFTQQCKADNTIIPSDPALRGTLKYNYIDARVPTADAGMAQTVVEASQVTLDASLSSSTIPGELQYQWQQVSGSQVVLSDNTLFNPVFVAPVYANSENNLIFKVTVTDTDNFKAASNVDITITPKQPLPPVNTNANSNPNKNQNSGGGGGCTLNSNANFDVTFYIMLITAILIQLYRRRQLRIKVKTTH